MRQGQPDSGFESIFQVLHKIRQLSPRIVDAPLWPVLKVFGFNSLLVIRQAFHWLKRGLTLFNRLLERSLKIADYRIEKLYDLTQFNAAIFDAGQNAVRVTMVQLL